MARYNSPQHPDDRREREEQAQRIAAIGHQIGVPLRDLSTQIVALTEEIKSQNEETNRKAEKRSKSHLRWLRGSTISAVVFSLFSLGLSGVTLWILSNQLDKMEVSNEINREALTSVQRAYVSLKAIVPYYTQDTQGKVTSWYFTPQWENSGNTPTKVLRQHFNFEPRETPFPDDFDWQDRGPDKNTMVFVAPKATATGNRMSVSPHELSEVREGRLHLYFWGWAAYRDVFQDSKPHLTEFCQELTTIDGDVMTGRNVRFIFTMCRSHNCADETCEDYAEVEKRLAEPSK